MKYTAVKSGLLALTLTGALFVTSCRRHNTVDSDTSLAGDNALSEATYTDVLNIADDASDKSTGDNLSNYKTSSNCATVTHDTLSNPKTITVDFGTVNCLCNDGRYRRGKILVSYSGHYRDSGSVHAITFNNYYVNDKHVMGSKTVTNMGHNTSGQSYFTVVVNGLIIKPSGDSVIWNSNRVRTWTAGESTPSRLDDVYSITGSASGSKGGYSYTLTITNPLVKSVDCQWISSGTIELQPSGKALRIIDFGTGACDDQATVTIGGTVHNITLP